jgi:multimeric flavodoxin WrbA
MERDEMVLLCLLSFAFSYIGPCQNVYESINNKGAMKIVIINGSPRKNGSTHKVLDSFREKIEQADNAAHVDYYNLSDINPKYCTGCKRCYKTGVCIIKDDQVEQIHDKLKECDGILFGSPTYASNVSGLFKVFHDRVHMTMEQLLYCKPCINITTYENAMGHKTLKIMNEMAVTSGAYITGSLAVKSPFNGNPVNTKNSKSINTMTKKFMKCIIKNKPPVFSRLFSLIVVNLFLKPFVFREKENNKGLIESWKEKKLIKV